MPVAGRWPAHALAVAKGRHMFYMGAADACRGVAVACVHGNMSYMC